MSTSGSSAAALHPPAPLLAAAGISPDELECLQALERCALWLATWTIHHANHLREHPDGLKVGGHQASSASMVTLMTALYLRALSPADRVAVKPHASPVYHAILYLLGRQGRQQLERFRSLGGAQAYPSRTKDQVEVDFSTGSVGLGAAMASFAGLARDYLEQRPWARDLPPRGRMIALVGEAELDEGNVYEALLEGWKHGLRDVWWIVDYNRQSLDGVVADELAPRLERLFESVGWRVVRIKYGSRQQAAFARPGGEELRGFVDRCDNALYAALVYQGGAAFRARIAAEIGERPGVAELLAAHSDEELQALMTNLGGHDLPAILAALREAEQSPVPTCFLAWTIKGHGLPLAGHKDNHAGLLTPAQLSQLQARLGVPAGQEWEPLAAAGLPPARLTSFLSSVPFARPFVRRRPAAAVPVPESLPMPPRPAAPVSTQHGFGQILGELGRAAAEPGAEARALAERIVTTSPDVTVSTSLGPWVNRRGLWARREVPDRFAVEQVVSAQRWAASPAGQHLELGIAENNLFLLLASLGLAAPLFGQRLLPIGTVYDPFISRGLDALNYACYQDARFLLVGTPSGISLAPEGGAHQSVVAPLIGIGQPGLTSFEPAYVDELAVILRWAFEHLQAEQGGSVYLRLSTRPLVQPERSLDARLRAAILEGGYLRQPAEAQAPLLLVYAGAVAAEALAAHARLGDEIPGVGLLAVTSPDRLLSGWRAAQAERRAGRADARAPVERLLASVSPAATLITVHDGHPAALAWLGAVHGQRTVALGVDAFGQSGDLFQLFARHGIDTAAIVAAARQARSEAPAAVAPVASTAVAPADDLRFTVPLAPLHRLWAALPAGAADGIRIEDLVLRALALSLPPRPGAAPGAVGLATEEPFDRLIVIEAAADKSVGRIASERAGGRRGNGPSPAAVLARVGHPVPLPSAAPVVRLPAGASLDDGSIELTLDPGADDEPTARLGLARSLAALLQSPRALLLG